MTGKKGSAELRKRPVLQWTDRCPPVGSSRLQNPIALERGMAKGFRRAAERGNARLGRQASVQGHNLQSGRRVRKRKLGHPG